MIKFQKLIDDHMPALTSRSEAEKIDTHLNDILDRLEKCELKIETLKKNQINISSEVILNLDAVREISHDLDGFFKKIDSTKSTLLAVLTWALFFSSVGFVTYLVATYL